MRRLVAEVRGINLYGRQWVHGRDRKQLERVARYITRPPIAQERLSQRPAECGSIGDDCGGLLDCGGCPSGYTCGRLDPNKCAPPPGPGPK